MSHWEERVAIVTGGASGIGRAICEALETAGTAVVVADVNGDPPIDVTQREQVQELVRKTVTDHQRLDFMFNNAGIGVFGQVHDQTADDWDRVLDVNLGGVVNGVLAAYPVMREQGFGHIVNTASLAGLIPVPGLVPYAATKHAVVGLSTSLRAEAALAGVRVSAVCPGFVETAIIGSPRRNLEIDDEQLRKRVPLGPITPARAARDILRGVRRNRAVICTPPIIRLVWAASRWFPWILQMQTKHMARQAEQMRAK